MLIVFIILLILLSLLFYTVFVSHKMEICISSGSTYFKFGIFKIKPKKKKKKKESYVKVPKLDTVKTNIKGGISVYLTEKEEIISIVKDIFKHGNVKQFDIAVDYGTGDAAATAISYGIIWQIIAVIYKTVINKYLLSNIVNIAITPDYNNAGFDYKLRVVAKIKLYDYIKIIRRILKLVKRNKLKFR